MTIVVFEDPQCELLAPITLARLTATSAFSPMMSLGFQDLICKPSSESTFPFSSR